MQETPSPGFQLFDYVQQHGGDARFEGQVVCVFKKKSGLWRYVVEDDRGILHIFSDKNLRPWKP
jgi:hypothetical protein